MILKFVSPDGRRQEFELGEKTITIGRSPDVDILLPDKLLSRRHCGISYLNSAYFLRDLKSRNGTFINEQKVDVARLRHGDNIRVGDTVLHVEDPALAAAADGNKHIGTETAIKEVSDEMAQGKGYHTILKEIVRDERKTPRPPLS